MLVNAWCASVCLPQAFRESHRKQTSKCRVTILRAAEIDDAGSLRTATDSESEQLQCIRCPNLNRYDVIQIKQSFELTGTDGVIDTLIKRKALHSSFR
jgi:hypothetical protein